MYVPDLLSCVSPQMLDGIAARLGWHVLACLLHSAATGSHDNRRAAAVNVKAPSPVGSLSHTYASMIFLPFSFHQVQLVVQVCKANLPIAISIAR